MRSHGLWRLSTVAALIAVMVAFFSVGTPVAGATGDSLTVSVSANPTMSVPMTVSVSGSSSSSEQVYVFVDSNAGEGCQPNASDEDGLPTSIAINHGDAVGPGSFNNAYSFTPNITGTFLTCAYIADSSPDTPFATQSGTFEVGTPSVSVGFSTSANPTAGDVISIIAAGATQVGRELYVYVDSNTKDGCASTPDQEAAISSVDSLDNYSYGDSLSAGNFSKTYRYVTDDPGTYLLCGYVTDYVAGHMDGLASADLTVAPPSATVKISGPRSTPIGEPHTFTVSGLAAQAELLDVSVCPASGSCTDVSSGSGTTVNDSTVNGSFSEKFTFTPLRFQSYRITAKVLYQPASAISNLPVTASASAGFDVPTASLTGPGSVLTHTVINPAFTWTGAGKETFAVQIGHVNSGGVTPFEQIQQGGYGTFPGAKINGANGMLSNPRSLDGVGSFSRSRMHLDRPLPPGHYAWRLVVADAPAFTRTNWSRFTVGGKTKTVKRHLGNASTRYGNATPFAYPNSETSPSVLFPS